MQPQDKRYSQASARNGPRLASGHTRCNDCRQIGTRPMANGGPYCKKTGHQIPHPISGPVITTCPRQRQPEEE